MARQSPRVAKPLTRWTLADAIEAYGIERWGGGYFSVSEAGHVTIEPHGREGGRIDLKELVDELQSRGIALPLLLRFSDILRSRIEQLNEAFGRAIGECEYQGSYRGVYPIKVNQSRTVVEEIIEFGRPYHYGLEAGSKPELLAIMALLREPGPLVICNGYKDDEYIKMALLASKLGRTVVLVAEKPSEVDHIHRVASALGVKPTLGIRARLSARGAGRWEQSGGDRSKFGLSATEIAEAVEKLRSWNELDTLKLLHFHLGSQISSIRSIKDGLREAARLYVELHKLGCDDLRYFDVGGGLGVDYDGSQTNFASSMNYSMQEYANDVVWQTQQVCDEAGVKHPDLVTEAGRAVAAHHAVLVVEVLEVEQTAPFDVPTELPEEAHQVAQNLLEVYQTLSSKTLRESFHDAVAYKEEVLQLFNLGHLSLETRVLCEQLFWVISRRILEIAESMPYAPKELTGLEQTLSDTYFCNFSMFQSVPDAWAVEQLFPIMPVHRLREEPSRRGVLADITCDSDGCIDQFIGQREVKPALELHPTRSDEPYFLGIFLVGAYQEILGDMHNLFGDTNAVHVSLDPDPKRRYRIEEVFTGDTVSDVLKYVNYSPKDLVQRLRRNIEEAIKRGQMTPKESRQLIESYTAGLAGYTYLERD